MTNSGLSNDLEVDHSWFLPVLTGVASVIAAVGEFLLLHDVEISLGTGVLALSLLVGELLYFESQRTRRLISDFKRFTKSPMVANWNRGELYAETRRLVDMAKRRVLIVQRTPSLFLGATEPGKEEEMEFIEALERAISKATRGVIDLVYAFPIDDPVFLAKLRSHNQNAQIVDNMLRRLRENGPKLLFFAMHGISAHPMSVSDNEFAVPVTVSPNERLYIELEDEGISTDTYTRYKRGAQDMILGDVLAEISKLKVISGSQSSAQG